MDEMKVIGAKTMRGDIITKLYLNYGVDIRISSLKNALRSRGLVDEKALQRCIFYLGGEGKRYIHVELDRDNWTNSVIYLTPAGVNLAEGDIEDVGVIINE
ncbi:MAG: hypothetical protein NC409_12535 [Clostridium sp.]|nr:hypothetical protein [Clostridium sp.]